MLDDTFQTYNGELDNENEVYDFKEKAEIIISDPSKKQEIHDWLCTEGLGCGCLTRSVECKNFHKMLPNILEMDLKENEIELFNNEWRGVAHATFSKVALYTDFEFQKVNLTNNNKGTVFGQISLKIQTVIIYQEILYHILLYLHKILSYHKIIVLLMIKI